VDDLTGVLNRRAFLQHLRERIAEGGDGAVLLADVDDFKVVNDTHGHRVGDLLLVEVARVLSRFGTAGRLGGDEFACWVAGSVADAERAAADLRGLLRASLVDSPALRDVSVSLGIASGGPDVDVIDLLETADGQLYRRKGG
jgi:diguanylate cyclase (GGDEF)-like protein